jgi:hypothetical protein
MKIRIPMNRRLGAQSLVEWIRIRQNRGIEELVETQWRL